MADRIKQLGLIGNPLSHSFSKSYFNQKFKELNIKHFRYDLFELASIDEFPQLLKEQANLIGLNVTIPYKRAVIPFLDQLSREANTIGAVNVIKLKEGKLYGYNSDYYGFETSLINWLPKDWQGKALILGTGGASLAVAAVLNDRGISFQSVSRNVDADKISYQDAKERDLLSTHQLIINTTPLGMQPLVEAAPDLNYEKLGGGYYLFDLIYNPEITTFMQHGLRRGAKVRNGLEMLELQAEKSWEIWTGNL